MTYHTDPEALGRLAELAAQLAAQTAAMESDAPTFARIRTLLEHSGQDPWAWEVEIRRPTRPGHPIRARVTTPTGFAATFSEPTTR